ncbi:hypothetical protein LCGC14_0620600 [marine sediment metagenome]|uniref:Uncharacterized protein n=1 Tax=marine sediment metagenome TaxID=412755 RepID=A0A0F9RP85_9ZZZZ
METLYLTIGSLHLFGPEAYGYQQQLLKMIEPQELDTVITVVAVPAHLDNWYACIGWPHKNLRPERAQEALWQPRIHPEDVAKSGDKIGEELARRLFPEQEGTYYL